MDMNRLDQKHNIESQNQEGEHIEDIEDQDEANQLMPGQFKNEATARMLINRLKCDEKLIDSKIQKIKQDLYPEQVIN